MSKQTAPAPALQIGASVEAVESARETIEAILKHRELDSAVLIQALKALTDLCGVSNVSVTNCTFGL